MKKGGYIPSYSYGGMPKYGFGSWIKDKTSQVTDWAGDKATQAVNWTAGDSIGAKAIGFIPGYGQAARFGSKLINKYNEDGNLSIGDVVTSGLASSPIGNILNESYVQQNAGTIGGVTGGIAGAFIGGPAGAMAGYSLGSSIGGLAQGEYEQDQQFAAQNESLLQQQQQQQLYSDMLNRNNLIQSRLSGYNNQQPRYSAVFKNGGGMDDGNRLKSSYNQFFPQRTVSGDTIYITPTTTKTLADTASFKRLNDNYSYFTDKKKVPYYGNVNPAYLDKDNRIYFRSDWQGDTKLMEDIFKGKFNPKEHKYIPSYSSGGSINISPSKRGTFTTQATKMGMGVQEAASKILSSPEGRYTPEMRKKANFARNSKSWNKAYGGDLDTVNNPNVTAIDNGGSHESNILGGIPISNRGLVEEGEVIAKINGQDYVFSNRF